MQADTAPLFRRHLDCSVIRQPSRLINAPMALVMPRDDARKGFLTTAPEKRINPAYECWRNRAGIRAGTRIAELLGINELNSLFLTHFDPRSLVSILASPSDHVHSSHDRTVGAVKRFTPASTPDARRR